MTRPWLTTPSLHHRASKAPLAALLLVPGAATIALAFQSGGYGTRATALAATEMVVLLAVWLLLAPRQRGAMTGPLAVAVVGLAALSGWAALSATWSPSPERAAPEAVRTMLYAATLALFGLVITTPRRARILVLGLAAGIVVVCVAALASRTLPDLVSGSSGIPLRRLAYPVSYWNALGLLAAVGGVLCVHLTCHEREPAWVRRLAAAALPLLAATIYLTLSRGAALAALAGVGVYLLLARPPALLPLAAAVGPPTAGALAAAHFARADRFTAVTPDPATVADARWVALALAACALAASILRGRAWRGLPRRASERGLRPRGRLGRASWTALAVAVAGVAAALLAAGIVSTSRDQLPDRDESVGASRLVRTESGGRPAYWAVALDLAADRPLRGAGAGTFELAWARDREIGRLAVQDAHSLYLETLGELGIVGLVLLLTALGTIALGLVRRLRGRSRDAAMWAALLGAGLAWLVHAGVEWDWELPAVSVWLFAVGGAALAGQAEAAGERRLPWRYDLLRWALAAGCVLAAIPAGRLALAAGRFNAAIEAAEAGDCRTAEARAGDSLRLRDHSAPYVVLAWCRRGARPAAAKRAMAEAIQRDPEDWRLHYDFALVLAAGQEDPRPEAETARVLNPRDPDVLKAAGAFAAGTPKTWPASARESPFLLR